MSLTWKPFFALILSAHVTHFYAQDTCGNPTATQNKCALSSQLVYVPLAASVDGEQRRANLHDLWKSSHACLPVRGGGPQQRLLQHLKGWLEKTGLHPAQHALNSWGWVCQTHFLKNNNTHFSCLAGEQARLNPIPHSLSQIAGWWGLCFFKKRLVLPSFWWHIKKHRSLPSTEST